MDIGAWQATVHGVAKSRTRLRATQKVKIKIEMHLITRGKAKVCREAVIGIVCLISVFLSNCKQLDDKLRLYFAVH